MSFNLNVEMAAAEDNQAATWWTEEEPQIKTRLVHMAH